MPVILSDHDVEGQLKVLFAIWTSPDWVEIWEMLNCRIRTFHSLGIAIDTADSELWELCQAQQFVLLTGNRNADTDDSVEIASRKLNQPSSLPVITIADARRVTLDRQYAERVASQILEILYDLEKLRGTRRLFVP
jgi:hypothetical protein